MAFPLYSMKDQVKMRDLCWIGCFCCLSCVCFSVLVFMYFSWKAPLFMQRVPPFMRKNRTRSICVYTCTIYTYMHHQIPPKYKIYLVGLSSVLYERPGQNERDVFSIGCFCCFSCAFHRKVHWFSCKKYHISWKPTKPGQYVCIHVPFTHTYTTCTTKYHQNMIYLVGLPSVLYERPGQNERDVFSIGCFCCFSCAFHRKCWFSY